MAAVEGMFRSVLQRPYLPKNSSRKQRRLVSVAGMYGKTSISVQTLQCVQNVAGY